MSRDVLTVGSTMRIPLLYRGDYSQWVERFMNYLEEQTDGEAMINSIKNSDQPLPRVTQVSIARTTSAEQPPLKDKSVWMLLRGICLVLNTVNKTGKLLFCMSETFKATEGELLLDTYIRYLQVINDLKKFSYLKDNCELNFKFLNNLQPEWKQYAIMMRQNKNLMEINIDALYNILKQNQGDVNDAMGSKKKTVVVTSDPLALIAKKTKVSKSKEKVFVSSDSEESEFDDFSKLKKITALLAKAFNRRKFYSKPTNNNLRTSSSSQSANKKQEFVKTGDKKEDKKANEKKRDMSKAFNRTKFYSKPTNNNLRTSSSSQSANKKQEFVKTDTKKVEKKDDEKKRDMSRVKCYNCKKEGHFAKDCKKAKVKDYEYYKTKMLLAKKDKDEQVLLDEDQVWMESSSDSDQEINANMVFMAQIEKVLSDSEASSSSADEKISEVSYYLSESESESEYETSEYYDNTTNYVTMTKVIKEEFKKLESLKIDDDSFGCNTSPEIFYQEFDRMSRMDDDLFTYEARGDDEVELTDEESSDSDNEDEVAELFKIDTNVFDFETPMCRAVKEFNYHVPWVHERPWMDNGVWEEPTLVRHHCEPFNYKNGCSELPTCSWKDDGYCNGGNMPGAYIIGNTLRYQDLEWYEALKDSKLKEEALKNRAIMEGIINDDNESSNKGWKTWDNFENINRDHEEREYKKEHKDEERCELFDNPHQEAPVCKIRRFEIIKYSFDEDKEYVAIKEHGYDDLTSTNEDACRAYQEIFRRMDEDKMSRDVITVGSKMRILLLYRGEYSQWRKRFMNYLEEKTNGEAMINSIQNGDQPLPIIAQVSLAGTAQNAPPTLKDTKFWTAKEKKTRKIDRLARSLLIQGLPNDIYSLIDSNETAKDLWDAP
uniref:CCHC-type domain-containing protein n=1 Tax=Tanacetum cinerariifolium TaxID=118510 RepID=A0A6L2LPT8_TANCI|nr:hypothetical protein [Tanacetum cinerariifolium]